MVATPAAGIATIRIPPMAMPQWDDLIEEIKRTKLSLGASFWQIPHCALREDVVYCKRLFTRKVE